jgi:hypothetical protein
VNGDFIEWKGHPPTALFFFIGEISPEKKRKIKKIEIKVTCEVFISQN